MATAPHPTPSDSTPQQLQELALKIAGERTLRITVNGVSMQPIFSPGDAVLVDSTQRKNPDIGQIITFINGEVFVTHRVVDKTDKGYLLKGDNALAFDPLVGADDIIGVVVAIDRNGSWQPLHSRTRDQIITYLSRWDGTVYNKLASKGPGVPRYISGGFHRIIKALIRLTFLTASQSS